MKKPNNDLRMKARGNGVPLWAIGDKMEMSEQTLIRKWRKELSREEKEKIHDIIENLKAGEYNVE